MMILLILYAVISRFFLIDKIPPLINQPDLTLRYFSAFANIVTLLILFWLIKKITHNSRVASLTSWVFALLPWTYEQGRIVSQPQFAVFGILLLLFLVYKSKFRLRQIFYFFIPFIIYFAYPQFWLFKLKDFYFNIDSFTNNLFHLASFDFLFFKNTTFWWGGVKEFGVMFLAFLPFFLLGVYRLFVANRKKLIILFLFITLVAAASPFYPESREFFLSTPIIAYIVASGVDHMRSAKSLAFRLFLSILAVLIVYEIAQFYHFYFIHYRQEVKSNLYQIHEAF